VIGLIRPPDRIALTDVLAALPCDSAECQFEVRIRRRATQLSGVRGARLDEHDNNEQTRQEKPCRVKERAKHDVICVTTGSMR